MEPPSAAPPPRQLGQLRTPPIGLCLGLAAEWALLGAATCAVTFIVSTIPAPVPDGRSIPLALELVLALLAVGMLPACLLTPIPLLLAGLSYLRRSVHARPSWVAAWTTAASACIAVEALFWARLVHLVASSFANLPDPSWHALDFSVGFAVVGAIMAGTLLAARSAARSG